MKDYAFYWISSWTRNGRKRNSKTFSALKETHTILNMWKRTYVTYLPEFNKNISWWFFLTYYVILYIDYLVIFSFKKFIFRLWHPCKGGCLIKAISAGRLHKAFLKHQNKNRKTLMQFRFSGLGIFFNLNVFDNGDI